MWHPEALLMRIVAVYDLQSYQFVSDMECGYKSLIGNHDALFGIP